MPKLKAVLATWLLLGAAANGATTATAQGSAPGQVNCDWYARTALRQQQENEKRKCGFAGGTWSGDFGVHVKWCAGVAPNVFLAEAQKRDSQLATTCGKK